MRSRARGGGRTVSAKTEVLDKKRTMALKFSKKATSKEWRHGYGGWFGRDAQGSQDVPADHHAHPRRHLVRRAASRGQAAAGDRVGPEPRGQPADGPGGSQGARGAQPAGELDGSDGRDFRHDAQRGGG